MGLCAPLFFEAIGARVAAGAAKIEKTITLLDSIIQQLADYADTGFSARYTTAKVAVISGCDSSVANHFFVYTGVPRSRILVAKTR